MARTSSIYDHFIIWPSSIALTINLPEQIFQMTRLLFKENNWGILLIPCINVVVKIFRTDACTIHVHRTDMNNYSICEQLQQPVFFSVFRETGRKMKAKITWFVYCPLLVTTFTHCSCKKWRHGQTLPKVVCRNVNKNISVVNIDVYYVMWQCVTYAYGCTHSERWNIQRAEIKITEEVNTLIKQFNTCLQMGTRGDTLL